MDIQHYYDLIEKYPDIESISAVWAEINTLTKQLTKVKKLCHQKLITHLQTTGEAKVKTSTSTFGWTNPKPKLKLNQKAWQDAVLNDSELYARVTKLEYQQAQIKRLQEPYIEEVTPKSQLYIK